MPGRVLAAPSYHGVQVIVDPYDAVDMNFLTCAAYGRPVGVMHLTTCPVTPTNNPFVVKNNAATGILLRIPWCAFQTDMLPVYLPSHAKGSCHYVVDGLNGAGVYYAGAFADGSSQIAAGKVTVERNSYIGNLSLCATPFDECPTSVLLAATAAIATIAAMNPTNPISVSLGLIAGFYTPNSVLDRPNASIDLLLFHRDNGNVNYCTRQPLAWRKDFIKTYLTALDRLFADVRNTPGMPPITLLKVSPMSAQSLEFNVDAREDLGNTTELDPSGPRGNGVQNDPVVLCPDHRTDLSPANGVNLLVTDYNQRPAGSLNMADAYESAFGYVVGHEFGLMVQNGLMSANGAGGGILSVANAGAQSFAHVACDTILATGSKVADQPLSGSPCVIDPAPGGDDYDWSTYYFLRFIDHLFVPGTKGFTQAKAAYVAVTGNGVYALQRQQLAINFTGLEPPSLQQYSVPSLPSCILNNVNGNTPFAQQLVLHTSSVANGAQADTITIPGPVLATPGTIIGWQTQTGQAQSCGISGAATFNSTLAAGVNNGGQFIEIETDTAGSSSCWAALRNTAVLNLVPSNALAPACLYPGQ